MPRKRSVFDEEIDLINKFEGNKSLSKIFEEFRKKWREEGPVKFAYEILRVDPNTGHQLILSNDQVEFLEDLWKERTRLAIIIAGRGSGKTFVLAIYTAWRIFCFERWHVAAMGGSAEQSDKIRAYLVGWIRNNKELNRFKLKMTEDEIKSYAEGSVTFHACSGTSVRGPHCVSEDTMIFSENGWKFFKDLKQNEKVATLNPQTLYLEYQIPSEIVIEDYEGEMEQIKNDNIDMLVTPNHRMFLKTNRWRWKIQRLNDSNFPKRFYMKRNCNGWNGIEQKIFELPEYKIYRGNDKWQYLKSKQISMDLWIEFFGYYITEGNTDNRKIKIRQSKIVHSEKYEKIHHCIQQMSFPFKAYDDKFIIYSTQLSHYLNQFGSYAWTKFIPKEIKSLSLRQLKILLDACTVGDGHLTKTGILIGSSSNQLRDDYMEIGLKCGYAVVARDRKEHDHFFPKNNKTYTLKEFHEVYMSKMGEIRFSPKMKCTKYPINYKGKVCCVNVPNHIIFLKRNGKTVWSGNTHDVLIDEEAEAEKSGGEKTVKAAIWDVSTSPDIHIVKSSTAHYVRGDLLFTWNNYDKLGYKRYRWAIAKHISGETDPYKIYTDNNPKNWKSNVPWIPDRNIPILRVANSNDEWLVEGLGGISITSGLVFNPLDIESCICSKCLDNGEQCLPYKEGHCPIVQYYLTLEGMNPNEISSSVSEALQNVKERVEGADWGKNAPCAYSVVGRFRNTIFVLFSAEKVGQSDKEKVGFAANLAKNLLCEIIRPDPREWAYNNALASLGFAVHELFSFEGGQEKNTYLYVLKKYIERHRIIIPCAFEDLIRSFKQLTYDDKGNIVKVDDHSFDSLLYAVSYYGEVANQTAFWKVLSNKSDPLIEIDPLEEEIKTEKNVKKEKKKDNIELEEKPKKDSEDNPFSGFDLW